MLYIGLTWQHTYLANSAICGKIINDTNPLVQPRRQNKWQRKQDSIQVYWTKC